MLYCNGNLFFIFDSTCMISCSSIINLNFRLRFNCKLMTLHFLMGMEKSNFWIMQELCQKWKWMASIMYNLVCIWIHATVYDSDVVKKQMIITLILLLLCRSDIKEPPRIPILRLLKLIKELTPYNTLVAKI